MSRYRRLHAGPTYFFTVVTHRRRPLFSNPAMRTALGQAIRFVRDLRPFVVDTWVLLPDHMHCIWTLYDDDADYSMRWAMIKRYVSTGTARAMHHAGLLTASRQKHRESSIWQRRFWEHQIRDEEDFERHMDYIHFNPVKHKYVQQVGEWPHSTFHRYVREGMYARDWGGSPAIAETYLE